MKKFSGLAANRALFAVLAVVLIAAPAGAASAQGLFDFFNGTPRQAPQTPAPSLAYADPVAAPPKAAASAPRAAGSGSTVAYCVRLCDGRHFPIQHHSAATPVQLCARAPRERDQGVLRQRHQPRHRQGWHTARRSKTPSRTGRGLFRLHLQQQDQLRGRRRRYQRRPTLRSGDVVATRDGGAVTASFEALIVAVVVSGPR